jgi:regulatory protein
VHELQEPTGEHGDGPAGERRGDPAERLAQARAVAWRALNRREHTVAELRALLERRRVGPEERDVVLAELEEGGYVDDARFAEHFADDRRRLDGWGGDRIARRLRELGIARDLIDAVVEARPHEEELAAAVALLERRVPVVPETRRDRDRALGILLRRGYDAETALDALRRHAGIDELD